VSSLYAIEYDGIVTAQYQAATKADALDRYAIALGFVDYSHLLDRIPIHERHRIVVITPDDDASRDEIQPRRSLVHR
jgi:hypothetical protein